MLSIISVDINKEEDLDIIYGGNLYSAQIETCRHHASIGRILLGNGAGKFSVMPFNESVFL